MGGRARLDWYTQTVLTGEARTRAGSWVARRLRLLLTLLLATAPALGHAAVSGHGLAVHAATSSSGCTEADVTGLTVRAVVTAAGFGAASGVEPQLPVSMTVANHTGRDLRNVEARQALDGALDGAVIAGAPTVTLGGVEYDSRGLMWQGHLVRNQVAKVSYALSAPAGSPARQALQELRPGARLDTTITSSSAECG